MKKNPWTIIGTDLINVENIERIEKAEEGSIVYFTSGSTIELNNEKLADDLNKFIINNFIHSKD